MAPIMSLMAAMLGPAPLPSSSSRRVQRRARCVLHKFSNDHANTDRKSGAQAESDPESMIRESMEAFELIDMCREQGICYCKHGLTYSDHAKDRRILERIIHEAGEKKPRLYLHWSVEELKNEVKLRNIKLPKKRTRLALIGILGLLRPRIPPLCVQFKDMKPGGYFSLGDKAWLGHLGPDKIRYLRHISFRMTELFDEYDLHIDLASRSASAWRMPFGNEVILSLTTAGLEILSLAAKYILDSRSMWTFAGVDFSGIRGSTGDDNGDDDDNDDANDDEEESDDDEN
ncbi:hypothetical protein E4T42_01634 [Aureobasidium subglaciale]|nr:hypothetical protein E4T42_01634 [Aureobasidium subglaciale]